MLLEISKMEQRYEAVLAVVRDGHTVQEVADAFGVTRQSVHGWLRRYEEGGLEALAERSHRPRSCPHQLSPMLEAAVLGCVECTRAGAAGLIERIVRSAVDGRVTEVFAPGRSRVRVVLDDGEPQTSTEYRALIGLVPIPGWKQRGRVVTYRPFRRDPS